MNSRNALLLSVNDYERIAGLVLNYTSENLEQLLTELDRATILKDEDIPHTVVKMNSTLVFKDLHSLEEAEVTLVYPEHSNLEKNKISILAPLGSALIGLSEGQDIEWAMPNGKVRKLQIVHVKRDNHPLNFDS